MTNNSFEFLPLDNAGKVFPGQNSRRWSNVFRFTVQLKESVDPEILKQALEKTLQRIPSFKVRIRNGFFANFFETNENDCPLSPDIKNPCYRINFKENNGYLFRVYYHGCRVSIDVYHALCDGYGGVVFISTLIGEYLRLKGCPVSYNSFVLNTDDEVKAEEYEDAYERYSSPKANCNLLETAVYHHKGTKLPLHTCNYTTVTFSFSQLHALVRSYGVTVTEFLAAILLDIHYRMQLSKGRGKKDVSVQIPVNLRKAFPSETLRNFVICLSVKISPDKRKVYTFEEILKSISKQLRTINNTGYLHAYITQTVNLQTKTLKYVPLALKNSMVKIGFSFGAEYSTSALLSNFGLVSIPEEMKEYVEKLFFFTGPGLVNSARCGVVSLGDNLTFTFSNCHKECDIEEAFLKRLVDLGLSVTVETNRDTDFSYIDGITVGDKDAFSDTVFIPSKENISNNLKSSDMSLSRKIRRAFRT